jgi:clan AA aspartic protease (TIGR02281 family)
MVLRTDIACFSIALLAISGGSVCAEGMVYKCKNPQGNLIYQESPCKQDTQAISSWTSSITRLPQDEELAETSNGIYVIKQRGSGHYFMDGKINGKALTFVIDTGASIVSLPRPVAFLARISCKEQIQLQTAGGSTSGCTAVIASLRFGPFLMKDVPAVIVPNLDQPLLGMNVLNQFKIEQSNGEMRISIRD